MSGSRIASVESFVSNTAHVLRITDTDGAVGIGQSSCFAYPSAVDAVVRDHFAGYLIGQDPSHIERHWHTCYRMGPFRGNILSAAVAAVDIALWDLRSRQLGVPADVLLGGRYREKVRLHKLLVDPADAATLVSQAVDAAAEGFTAIKFEPVPPDHHSRSSASVLAASVETAVAVREAVGDDVDLILELHRLFPLAEARTILERFADVTPLFVEDPVQIDSVQTQGDLARHAPVPLGIGERLVTLWEFRELLVRSGGTFLRADIGLAGGLTHLRKIAALGEAFGSRTAWHSWAGPVIAGAHLQLELSTPNTATHEWWPALDEPGAVPGLRSAHRREGGWLVPADEPGLGVTFDAHAFVGPVLHGRAHLHDVPRRPDGSVALAV